jgi:spore coat polysaccharide biosynthesis predicted glycosyltransferase SpsG
MESSQPFAQGVIHMDRIPILFRCDASALHGYEFFYQCLAYAAALQRRRRGTYFLSQLTPATLLSAIQKGGNEWRPADFPVGSPDDLQQTVRTIEQLQAAAVVVADPNVSTEYLSELCRSGVLVIVIDSHAAERFPRCLLINPLLGPNQDSYDVAPGSQLLVGARYALVRPFIRRIRPMRAQEPSPPFRVMVALGDDDFRGQVIPRTKELLACTRVEKIDVVIRAQHPAMMDLVALAQEHSERLEVVTEPTEIGLRLSRCHLALTSGDAWSLELACVGIPQMMLVQSPWHMLNAQRLDDEGAATLLGDCESVGPGQLRQAIQALLSDPRERASMSRSGRKLIDGRGPDRLVNALEVMLARPQFAQDLRQAA